MSMILKKSLEQTHEFEREQRPVARQRFLNIAVATFKFVVTYASQNKSSINKQTETIPQD